MAGKRGALWLLGALLLVLQAGAQGQDSPRTREEVLARGFRFDVIAGDPADRAFIYVLDKNNHWAMVGRANQFIGDSKYGLGIGQIKIEKAGFYSQVIGRPGPQDFVRYHDPDRDWYWRYRETIRLDLDLMATLRLHPVLLGLVPLMMVLLATGFGYWRRHSRRLRLLEKLSVPAGDPMVGRGLGKYRIVDRLGAGGMATVYLALPEETLEEKDAVAIKVVNPEMLEDDQFRRRFEREVRTGCELSHPSIVRIISWGEDAERLYLVMERVKGQTLKQCIPANGLSLDSFGKFFLPVAEALQFAHSRGIVHRDVKPDNVMVTDSGRVILMDFGLARSHQYTTVTVSGTALGTPAYMAPEQAMGNEPDPRSDQYSLGVMAFQMLSGRLPFEDTNPVALIYKHVTQEAPPLGSLRPNLPAGVEAVVKRMMAKDPNDRYPSMQAARDAMQAALV